LAEALLNGDSVLGSFNSEQQSVSTAGDEESRRREEVARLQVAIEKGFASGISDLSLDVVLEQARERIR
jgi:hypothetical protein